MERLPKRSLPESPPARELSHIVKSHQGKYVPSSTETSPELVVGDYADLRVALVRTDLVRGAPHARGSAARGG